jgi:hypothetical protein
MAKFLTLTATALITDGGVEAVNREFELATLDIDDYISLSLKIAASGSKFLAVEGTNIGGKTDPIVFSLIKIHGVVILSNQQLGIKVDGADAAISIGANYPLVLPAISDTIEIENEAAAQADIKLIVWGDK